MNKELEFNLPEDICLKLERLHFETNSYSDIIRLCCTDNEFTPNCNFNKIKEDYEKSYSEYNMFIYEIIGKVCEENKISRTSVKSHVIDFINCKMHMLIEIN